MHVKKKNDWYFYTVIRIIYVEFQPTKQIIFYGYFIEITKNNWKLKVSINRS